MFQLSRQGLFRQRIRLTASDPLTDSDFLAIARDLGTQPRHAKKVGFVAARVASSREVVTTRWNGIETVATAEPGAWIATTVKSDGTPIRDRDGRVNTYVIKDGRFRELYAPTGKSSDHGDVYRPLGKVEAIYLSGGFEIRAPWGQTQVADVGYLLLSGNEVYGNHKDTFERSYRLDS